MKFQSGQRISVAAARTNKKRRIGTIQYVTEKPVYIFDESRMSTEGETSYLIFFTPNGGGHWWSEKYLQEVRHAK